MLKRFIAASVVTAAIAMSGTTAVHADRGQDDNYRYNTWSIEDDHRGDRYNRHNASKSHSRKTVVKRKIHRRVIDEALPLRRLLDLDRSYTGYRVKSVAIKIRPYRSYGRVKLLVNGHAVDRQRIDDEKWITLRTDNDKTIGRDLRSLKLGVRGKLYIKDIQVTLKKPVRKHRHSNVSHKHKTPPKVTVVKTRPAEDPVERLLRIILKDIRQGHSSY